MREKFEVLNGVHSNAAGHRPLPVDAPARRRGVKAGNARASGTRLLAAVVLSACVGVIGGGLGAWGVYSHFGPVERVVTETKTGGGAVSVGDIATAVLPSLVTISTQPVTAAGLATGARRPA